MRNVILILLFPALCFAQEATQPPPSTVSYRLDLIRPDSFFLVEVVSVPNVGSRPTITEYPQLFRSKEQLANYTQYLNKQAEEAREQAKKLTDAAPKIEAAARVITKVMEASEPYFSNKKPEEPPATKKKKKKKG